MTYIEILGLIITIISYSILVLLSFASLLLWIMVELRIKEIKNSKNIN